MHPYHDEILPPPGNPDGTKVKEPPDAEPVQEADFITEDVMRSAFVEQRAAPVDIPIPPVIEEAVEQAPRFGFSISSLLAKTHMSANQLTILGAFALLDFLVISVGFVFVALNMMR